ncbi:hypothetical protein PVK06_015030 [Gossypium arboreum]|uniref:Uncharacterized protein n=1 Tax=Gossypium arboreum TaxID=29729 RepID=A0ABR0PW25_GOSAR|nr:hypothetical protein PVK06_015030 [Gossypium arboreum]
MISLFRIPRSSRNAFISYPYEETLKKYLKVFCCLSQTKPDLNDIVQRHLSFRLTKLVEELLCFLLAKGCAMVDLGPITTTVFAFPPDEVFRFPMMVGTETKKFSGRGRAGSTNTDRPEPRQKLRGQAALGTIRLSSCSSLRGVQCRLRHSNYSNDCTLLPKWLDATSPDFPSSDSHKILLTVSSLFTGNSHASVISMSINNVNKSYDHETLDDIFATTLHSTNKMSGQNPPTT